MLRELIITGTSSHVPKRRKLDVWFILRPEDRPPLEESQNIVAG